MTSPQDHCANLPQNADVQAEMTRMVFNGLPPILMVTTCGTASAVVAIVAQSVKDHTLLLIVSGMFLACLLRICVALQFNAHASGHMTAIGAFHWELGYGGATLLFCALLAAATVHNYRWADPNGKIWCTLGSFAFCSGLTVRSSLRPWITQTCACVVFSALIISLIAWSEHGLWPTAILPILYTYLFCKSADAKFQMTQEQIRTQRQLSYLAENDVLTGLANRRRFIAELEMCCKQALPFAIMYIDLDRFKAVNDTYGHAIGDELLRAVSDRLRRTVRISDTVVRLGGDEFAVLQAAPTTEQTAQGLAERINRDLEAPFQIQGLEIRIGSSIGIRFASEGYFDPDAIIRSADDALYVVKRSGRGSFAFAGGLGSLRESGNGPLAPSYGNNIAPDSKS